MEQIKITLPIFALIGVGYVSRVLIKKQNWTSPLNKFVYYISLPSLIVYYFSRLSWSNDTLAILFINFLILIVSAALLLPISLGLRVRKQLQAAFFLTSLVGNSIYLGIPLAQRAFNGDSSVNVIAISSVIQLVGGILVAVVAVEYFFMKTNNISSVVKHVSLNPLFIGSIAGVLLSFISKNSWYISTIDVPIKMLANTASPVALFALGSFLYGHTLHKHLPLVGVTVFIKLAVYPALAFTAMQFAHYSRESEAITILMCAMPTAVTAFVLAQKYELDSTFVANAMLVSAVISAIATPLWLTLI